VSEEGDAVAYRLGSLLKDIRALIAVAHFPRSCPVPCREFPGRCSPTSSPRQYAGLWRPVSLPCPLIPPMTMSSTCIQPLGAAPTEEAPGSPRPAPPAPAPPSTGGGSGSGASSSSEGWGSKLSGPERDLREKESALRVAVIPPPDLTEQPARPGEGPPREIIVMPKGNLRRESSHLPRLTNTPSRLRRQGRSAMCPDPCRPHPSPRQ
jgi:hypothetical protein